MVQIAEGDSHGLFKVLVQLVGADGLSYGVAGEDIAAGATSPAYVVDDPKSANIPVPDRTTIDFTGGDVWIQSFQYGITSLGSFDWVNQSIDANLIALATGTLVDQTSNDLHTVFTEDVLSAGRPQVSLVFIYRIQSTELATFGATKYIHAVIPRCWLAPKGTQNAPAFQAAGDYVLQVTPTVASRKINGPLFDSNLNASGDKVSGYYIIADNPLHMTVFRATAASPTPSVIVAPYKPIDEAIGAVASTRHEVDAYDPAADSLVLGVADSIVKATGTYSVGNGGLTVAIDDIITILYETAYEAV